MDYRKTANEIIYDIDTGIYDTFPVLKSKLQYLSKKMIESTYVENMTLSDYDLHLLKENEYYL